MSSSPQNPIPPRYPDGASAADTKRHPIRWFIAILLSDWPMTASELAAQVEMKPSAVRRHLREMEKAGTIEVVEMRPRRGAGEKVYGVLSDFVLSDEDRAELSLEERRRLAAYTLKVGLREALRSLVSNSKERSPGQAENVLARVPMVLDEAGWNELSQIHVEFYTRVMELRDRIEQRLRDRGEDGIRATSLVLCFEVTPPT
jgi:predicted transcriptional regulator